MRQVNDQAHTAAIKWNIIKVQPPMKSKVVKEENELKLTVHVQQWRFIF